jgi:hypothetical protein
MCSSEEEDAGNAGRLCLLLMEMVAVERNRRTGDVCEFFVVG